MNPDQKKDVINQTKQTADVANEKTLELIYSEIKDRLKTQQDSIKDLENKAGRIIGFVGLVVGLSITWIQLLAKDEIFKALGAHQVFVVSILYLLGIFILLLSIILAFIAYKVETYRADPNPQVLAENYFYFPYGRLLEQLIDNFATSYAHNNKLLFRKAKFVELSLGAFVLGLVAFFVLITALLLFV